MFPEFTAALIVPWLAGASILAAARNAHGRPPHPGRWLRLLGYGFFVGQALLYGVIRISSEVAGELPASQILWSMAALAALGLGVSRWLARHRQPSPVHPQPPQVSSWGERILVWLLLGWAMLHIVFALIDILAIPVYPWDAWLVWMYRAKAWFYSAGLPEIVAPGRWIAANSVPPYTIEAFDYPDFLSVTSAWLTLSLGTWHDSLVNLPNLACAMAIGLALAGHGQRLGLSPILQAAIVYLLFSTPLFGAHASLGGYADLWMAGFAGLGMVALVSGLPRRETGYVLLGLAMLTFSALVKNEGAVWLLIGLAMVVLFTVPAKLQWAGAGVIAGLAALAGAAGYTYFEIPGLGLTGLQDGRLHLPFIGRYVLETHNVLPAYGTSLFLLGSWNLLWFVVPSLAIATLGVSGSRARNVMLSFLLLFVASQAFIFGFTNQGEWAKQYTAINRLPLQFLPVLLYALAVAVKSLAPNAHLSRAGLKALVGPVAASILVTAMIAFWLNTGESDVREPIKPELTFVMGAGSNGPEGISVTRYQQGFALLSSGQTLVDAADFPFVRIELTGARFDEPQTAPAVFWRRGDDPQQVSRMTLVGTGLQRLDSQPDWSGQITEFGLLVPEAGIETVQLGGFALETANAGNRWLSTWRSWLTFEPWSLRSVNFLWGGAEVQTLRLTPVVAAWTLLAILLTWLTFREAGGRAWLRPAAVIFLIGWAALDVRWTLNGLRQAQQSVSHIMTLTPGQRLERLPDGEVWALVQRFHDNDAPDDLARILVVGNRSEFGYYLERAKYHLLPHSALVVPRLSDRLFRAPVDYVLFVDDFSADGAWRNSWDRLPMDAGWRDALELADANTRAILFRVNR